MRVVHSALATPGKCGLWETTREIVAAERALGIDACVVDPLPGGDYSVTGEDRGVPIVGMDWAIGADVIVNHSGFDGTPLAGTDQPVVHVSHGRPLSSFLGERSGAAPSMTWQTQRAGDDRYRAVVTLWPEYEPYLKNLWPGKPVYSIPACCDLDYWTPGESDYDFHGRRGEINVVMLDPWSREDSSPYHQIHAFRIFQKMTPGARLHMFAWDGNKKGLTGIKNLLGSSGGVIQGWAGDVRRVLRAADLLITPHRIYTRSIREAMACGVQVVSGRDVHPEDIEWFALEMARRLEQPQPVRKMAEALFSPAESAKAMLRVIESALPAEAARGD